LRVSPSGSMRCPHRPRFPPTPLFPIPPSLHGPTEAWRMVKGRVRVHFLHCGTFWSCVDVAVFDCRYPPHATPPRLNPTAPTPVTVYRHHRPAPLQMACVGRPWPSDICLIWPSPVESPVPLICHLGLIERANGTDKMYLWPSIMPDRRRAVLGGTPPPPPCPNNVGLGIPVEVPVSLDRQLGPGLNVPRHR